MPSIPSVGFSEQVDAVRDHRIIDPKVAPGTVMKPFKGPTRRFAVGYVLTDADGSDLPMSVADLKVAGLVA